MIRAKCKKNSGSFLISKPTIGLTGSDPPTLFYLTKRSYRYFASMLSYFSIIVCLLSNIFSSFEVSMSISACSICPGNSDSNTSFKLVSERWLSVAAIQTQPLSKFVSVRDRNERVKRKTHLGLLVLCMYSGTCVDKSGTWRSGYRLLLRSRVGV